MAATAEAPRAPATATPQQLRDADVQIPFTFDPQLLAGYAPAIGKPQWAVLPSAEETSAAFDAAAVLAAVALVCELLARRPRPPAG